MKRTIIFALCALTLISCSKDFIVKNLDQENSPIMSEIEVSEPLHFATIDELETAMHSAKTKSSSFVSYADVVMSTEEYEMKDNVILSEKFGSILNAYGEVSFDRYFLKVCDFGILYSLIEDKSQLQNLATKKVSDLNMTQCNNCPIPLKNHEYIFIAEGYNNVYIYDTFGLFGNKTDVTIEGIDSMPITKVASAISGDVKKYPANGEDLFQSGNNWSASFTIPKSSEQKRTFPSNDKIANDTKIWKQNYGITETGGVKSKTMKKGALGIWTKISAPVNAAVTNLVIQENWTTTLPRYAAGWVSVNKTTYGGKSYVIATKQLASGVMNVSMSEITLLEEIGRADEWARNGGVVFEKIDGIRYIGANGIVYVRLRDNVSFIEAKKSVVDFDLPYGGSFSIGDTWSNPNISGNIAGSKGSYTIFGVCMFGTSIYDNFEIGSRMVYTFKKAN